MSFYASATQLAFSYAHSPQEFFDRARDPIERAARGGAQLVALPNYTGLQLLGIAVPDADETRPLDEIARIAQFPTVAAMLHQVAPTMCDFFVHLFGALAQKLQVYLAPGTVIECEDNQLYNTAYLFAPNGMLIGAQRQTHRAPHEIDWGLSRGDVLNVFDIGCARIGFVIGADIAYPEVSRILALQNANLLIHPAAYSVWGAEHYLLDLWREVQSNQVIGLQACAVGNGFKGCSAIYAPIENQEDIGIRAQAASASAPEIVNGAIDFAAAQCAIEAYPIFDFFNYEFYAREFPNVYR
jgi:predicted amidohydrolase